MRPRWCWVFLVAGATATLAARLLHGELPPLLAIDAVEFAAAAAVVVGVRRNRPSHATAWYLLATGIGLLAIADLSWDLADALVPANSDAHTLANVIYLSAYPFLLAGLLQLARARTAHGDREALADAAIVTAAALIPVWQFFVVPEIGATISTFDQVSALLYPVLDLVLVAALARMLFGPTSRATSFRLLLAGLVVTTVADVVYLRMLANGQPTAGWLDPAWTLSYVLMGAAALHPSMRVLSEHTEHRTVGLARTRLALLASALFVGPAVVVIEDAKGRSVDPRIFGPMSVLVAALVTWRLVRLAGDANRSAEALRASEQRFRALVQHATDVIGVVDPGGMLQYVSPAIVDMLGYEPGHYLGTTVAQHMHPDDVPAANTVVVAALSHPGQVFRFRARGRHRDGTWRWLETSCTNHLDEPGVHGVVGNFHDVTERTRAELLLAGETRVLETIARSAPVHETLTTLATVIDEQLDDGHCAILLADEADGTSRLGAAPGLPMSVVEVIVARAPVDRRDNPAAHAHETVVVEDLARDPLWAGHADLLRTLGVQAAWSTPILGTDPERLFGTFWVFFETTRGPSPHERALVERFTSLTAIALDRTAAEERLEFLALHDALTELPNRALVLDRLRLALLRIERRRSVLAVLFLDLDRFKVINDSLGHHAGDELLVAAGKRIVEVVRPSDTVARLGGDEFVVVCEDVGGANDAERIAERIAAALTRPFVLTKGEVVVTASIGIALSDASTNQPDTLLRDADAAMYLAKERGRARHELFGEPLRSRAVVRLATERALRRAVDRDELRIHYQPQVDLRRHEVVSMEALLRWQHPTRGLLSPSEFLAVAEETGLIVPIGSWVLELACANAAQWRLTSPGSSAPAVSVNLSACQLSRPDLPDLVERLLTVHALEPDALCLEVSETVLLENVEVADTALETLADLGVRLAMDDFGTGYSSLSYLKRFPFHELKIDRNFVAGLGSDEADDAIVAATIQMAHALALLVTAEGVETALQLHRLEELGCDAAQGFYFARPQPIESLSPSLDADEPTRRLA